MLKTNSKKANENLKKWIVDNFDIEAVHDVDKQAKNIKSICEMIYKTFCRCAWADRNDYQRFNGSRFLAWQYWLSGLPSVINSGDYYYTQSAVDVLGEILEETETERNKYSETAAEKVMDMLLYRFITKTANV